MNKYGSIDSMRTIKKRRESSFQNESDDEWSKQTEEERREIVDQYVEKMAETGITAHFCNLILSAHQMGTAKMSNKPSEGVRIRENYMLCKIRLFLIHCCSQHQVAPIRW